MIPPKVPILDRLTSVRQNLWPAPPELAESYTLADYGRFMREETFHFSARYARRLVVMHGHEHLLKAARNSGAIVAFLHYGSWILAGGAIAHRLGLPYTVIASRRNLEIIPQEAQEEKRFWEGVHQRVSRLYGHPLFFTDQSPRQPIKWLKKNGHVLGVVLDVREPGQQIEEHPFQFLGHTIFMQSGPARLARIAGVPIVPATIQYRPRERRHHLYFDAPVFPNGNSQHTTQQVLQALEKYVARAPQQQFYDIIIEFGQQGVPAGQVTPLI
jgi:lauroyl/myristoyl acyltransferase